MRTLSKQDLESSLTDLGLLAAGRGEHIELLLFGGGLMVLLFDARASTRDLDVVITSPSERKIVRELAEAVARDRGLPPDWLNDGVKGFVVGTSTARLVFSAPGITVLRPSFEQLLAMKLCAWRDDVDIADAGRILDELKEPPEEIWKRLTPHLQPGRELKAKLAFDDLWESKHGKH